jgi:hypothetical protein
MHKEITEEQVKRALHLSKNGSATGMDGCPYKLWKTLNKLHAQAMQQNKPKFDITKTLTDVFTDILYNVMESMNSPTLHWAGCALSLKRKTEWKLAITGR